MLFMEHYGALLSSKESNICPCPEPGESSPHPPILYLKRRRKMPFEIGS